jgi:hypothetical protein
MISGRAERRDNLRPTAEHDLASSYGRSNDERSRIEIQEGLGPVTRPRESSWTSTLNAG